MLSDGKELLEKIKKEKNTALEYKSLISRYKHNIIVLLLYCVFCYINVCFIEADKNERERKNRDFK